VHHNDLVAGVIYREPEYDWYGVGVRLIDLVFSFAAEKGFETMDLGGGHDYKQKWAPQEGERWQFNVCPEYLYRAKQVVNWGRTVRQKVTDWVHSSQAQSH
jgi:CelD/BcsL family acetyltransferase involved in cellulose biosynthesis